MKNHTKAIKILLSPLDWGLGHTTRCIPIIHYLLSLNCVVAVAGAPVSLAVLKKEFPSLHFFEITSYKMKYTANKRWMFLKILLQVPKIYKAISAEHKQLKKILADHNFDAVISDNRFGFYAPETYNVFITHQLQVLTPIKLLTGIIRKLNYTYINRFNECWVPDLGGEKNLTGALSHPKVKPKIPLHYLGVLSRFSSEFITTTNEFKYIVIISGPEPHRSIFEKKILEIAKSSAEKFIIILGKPAEEMQPEQLPNCKIFNHLSTEEMLQMLAKAEFFVGRCGYTSVMEVLFLQKKSILIPTPGQPEQEYLAVHLRCQNWCYTFSEIDKFEENLLAAETFAYQIPTLDANEFKAVVENMVIKIREQG